MSHQRAGGRRIRQLLFEARRIRTALVDDGSLIENASGLSAESDCVWWILAEESVEESRGVRVCVCVKVPLLYGVRAPNLANTSVPAARSQVESLLAVGCPGGRVPSFRIAKCAGTRPCSPLKHNKTSNHANTKSPKWIERIWKIQKCQKYVRRGVKCLQCKIARKQKPNQNCTAHCPRKIPEKKAQLKSQEIKKDNK